MERVDLGSLAHSVERVWTAEVVQGRQPVIRVGRLADGRWWADRGADPRQPAAWVCGDQVQAEAVAHRWSCQSKLRWRPTTVDPVLP